MKVGIDMHHGFLREQSNTVEKALQQVKEEGYQGAYYKSPVHISPTLDPAELQYASDCAKDLGLYIDFGVGRVNPFNTNETPDIWLLGSGDYKLAMEKQIIAAASIGAKEFIGVTANFKPKHNGYFLYDRFRTDVTWEDQLLATEKFLKLLAPVLRDTGTRINLETHDEITSFEILRLIEAVGEDVLGVAFDTCNVVSIGEDPMAVVKRTAPYIHQMHAKDFIIFFTDNGLTRQVKPCGQGVVDFENIFREVAKYNPNLQLQVEDHKGYMPVDIYVKEWVEHHPDLRLDEISALVRYAYLCEKRIKSGELIEPEVYEAISYWDQRDERLNASREHLYQVLEKLGLCE